MVHDQRGQLRLVCLLIAGYLAAWTGFGVLIHLGDLAIHELFARTAFLEAREWAIGAGILVLAGIYQFTPLKYHCLDKCRSPLSFIAGHWSGAGDSPQAFRVGCCRSLMLLMFAVGSGNIGWMLGWEP